MLSLGWCSNIYAFSVESLKVTTVHIKWRSLSKLMSSLVSVYHEFKGLKCQILISAMFPKFLIEAAACGTSPAKATAL